MTRLVLALATLATIPSFLWAEEAKDVAVQFEPPIRLKAGDEFIDTGKHVAHAGPLVVDLDTDGKPDLLVGNYRGHVQVYMNTGTRAEPVYSDKGLLEADGEAVKIPNW